MRRFVVGALLILLSTPAHARLTAETVDRHAVNGWQQTQVASVKTQRAKAKRHKQRWDAPAKASRYVSKRDQQAKPIGRTLVATILPHPPGCPRTRFCGCGTSLYLLGKRVVAGGLAVASKWLDFPRVACAPRMAAARPGHVFAIVACLGDSKVLAYDPNSGGHKTRLHIRDLRRGGYAIVNPYTRSAAAG